MISPNGYYQFRYFFLNFAGWSVSNTDKIFFHVDKFQINGGSVALIIFFSMNNFSENTIFSMLNTGMLGAR